MSGLVGHRGMLFGGVAVTPTNRISITNTAIGTAATAHNVNMPSGTVSFGDLLLCQFSVPSNTAVTTPSGWTLLNGMANGSSVGSYWYYKVAAGTESGTTVNFVTAASVQAVATVHQIQAGTYGSGLLYAASVGGTSASPQSPSLPIPWGNTQNTALTGFGSQFNIVGPPTYPAGYFNGDWAASSPTTGSNIVVSNASAIRVAAMASESPPGFSMVNSRAWVAHTVFIGPNGTPALNGPVVLGTTSTAFDADATSHLVAMPATVSAGDLLIMSIATHDVSTQTTPSGWTLVAAGNSGGGVAGAQAGIFYKIATGTEGGTTVDVVTSAAQRGSATVHRIQAGTFDAATAPEVSSPATGTSAAPLPSVLSPSWGTVDTLFLATVMANNRRAFSTVVLGYSNVVQAGAAIALSTNAQVGSAYAIRRAATSWPAQFAMTNAESWIAYTVAIKPA